MMGTCAEEEPHQWDRQALWDKDTYLSHRNTESSDIVLLSMKPISLSQYSLR